jgi:hypothetical protein
VAIRGDQFGAHLRGIAFGMTGRAREVMRAAGLRAAEIARQDAPSRTGGLARTIRSRALRERAAAGFDLVVGHPAGAILEYGGTIRPKSVQFLAVPLRGQTSWPRHVGRHIVIRARSGRLFLFNRRPRDGGSPQYELRRRVDITARPYIAPAIRRVRAELMRDLPLSVFRTG